jgi:uncharacterized membrane-anchored protein YhcB (DUF1043 family)
MNPKSAPWCNGSQESFFGRFKVEFGEFDRFETYAELLEELYQQLLLLKQHWRRSSKQLLSLLKGDSLLLRIVISMVL